MEFLLLALATMVSVTSLMLWSKARRAEEAEHKALPPAIDRTPLTVQVGDIVEHLDRDWLVEGALVLSEAPRAARLSRLIDGAEERFLYARAHEPEAVWLLAPVEPPPESRAEELTHEGEPLRLERRWQAAALTAGKLGRRSFEAELTVYEYAASTGRFLLALDASARAAVFFGERLLPHAIEILPGRD